MKNKFILAGLAAILFVAAVFFLNRDNSVRVNSFAEDKPVSAVVEIVRPSAYADLGGQKTRELSNGETLAAPLAVKVSKDGEIYLKFADGSIARVSGGTEFILKEGSYDKTKKKLLANFFLSVGRIWSKIVELATPDSSWEIETSHAVATVRGTAFGVIASAGKSQVIGSQNKVVVIPIDPATKTRMETRAVIVEKDKFVEVGAAFAAAAPAGGKLSLAVTGVPASLANDPWVLKNKEADIKVQIELQRNARPILPAPATALPTSSNVVPAQTLKTGTQPVSIAIITKDSLASVIEGTAVNFRAVAKISDGTETDVTAAAAWQVIGPIGKMQSPGVFMPALDATVSEFGEGSGAVVASWTDPATKTPLLGKSQIFKVFLKINPLTLPLPNG